MAVLPYDQLYAVMDGAFGDLGPDVVSLMTAIAMAESGGNTAAHNNKGEDSRGLGQVNIGPGANTDLANLDLFDPAQNAKAMRIVYDRQGPGAWSVYSNGMYQPYMQGQAVPLAKQVAEPANVMAPRAETKQADPVPLIKQRPMSDADWQMLAPMIRLGGDSSAMASMVPQGSATVPALRPVPLIRRL